MKNSILFLALVAIVMTVSCKKDEYVEPNYGEYWTAHVHYESNIKKLPARLEFECGGVNFVKIIAARPTDYPYEFDTIVQLHEFDSLSYHFQYTPVNCITNEYNRMSVQLEGKYRRIVEVGFSSHHATNILLKGRVRSKTYNWLDKTP